jgi:hypothetical protein
MAACYCQRDQVQQLAFCRRYMQMDVADGFEMVDLIAEAAEEAEEAAEEPAAEATEQQPAAEVAEQQNF